MRSVDVGTASVSSITNFMDSWATLLLRSSIPLMKHWNLPSEADEVTFMIIGNACSFVKGFANRFPKQAIADPHEFLLPVLCSILVYKIASKSAMRLSSSWVEIFARPKVYERAPIEQSCTVFSAFEAFKISIKWTRPSSSKNLSKYAW